MNKKDQDAIAKLYLEVTYRNPQYYDPEGDKYQKEWEEKGVDRIGNFKTKSDLNTLKQLAKEIAPRKLKIYNYFSLRDDAELWPAIPLESEIMQNFKNLSSHLEDVFTNFVDKLADEHEYNKQPKNFEIDIESFLSELQEALNEENFTLMTEKEAKRKLDKILKQRDDKFDYQNPTYNDRMHYDDDGISPETYM